jgi:hypothetical protein
LLIDGATILKIQLSGTQSTKMKNLFATIIFITAVVLVSCKKSENNTPSKKLAQLQHTWMVIVRYGEVLRYTGTPDDYYNFSTNNTLYRRVGQISDTSYYQLPSSNDSLLLIYPFTNGIMALTPINYYIRDLSDTHLVISWAVSSNPPISVLDSLER